MTDDRPVSDRRATLKDLLMSTDHEARSLAAHPKSAMFADMVGTAIEPLRLIEPRRDVVDKLTETNTHLAQLLDQAKADAVAALQDAKDERRSIRWSLLATWVAVLVSVVVGVIQIVQ